MESEKNSYLGEVLQQQQRVDQELRRKAPSPMAARRMAMPQQAMLAQGQVQNEVAPPDGQRGMPGTLEIVGGGRAIDYRITGWWRWRTVVVPPNAWVVHTRRGREEPLTVGLGVSFGFNPYTDSFLVIPSAMQTIVINARCICLERQGILVQAYVQWIIDDIKVAYKRLEFSDEEDPMRIVNVQLREQAEAAIKDKVATLRIDEVLADKQPIIEELTTRLRTVADGSGLKIVTVQIKEAVVSSTRLWENLQKPFRAERERVARMAELETERLLADRTLEIRQARETAELETERAIEKRRSEKERETVADENATEKARRDAELELTLKTLEIARARVAAEIETVGAQRKLDVANTERMRAIAEGEAALAELKSKAQAILTLREIDADKARRAVENDLSDANLRARLVTLMPEIAAKLPAPKELKSIQITDGANGPAANLTALVAGLLGLIERRTGGGAVG